MHILQYINIFATSAPVDWFQTILTVKQKLTDVITGVGSLLITCMFSVYGYSSLAFPLWNKNTLISEVKVHITR